MSDNKVQIQITAKDNASEVINSVKGSFSDVFDAIGKGGVYVNALAEVFQKTVAVIQAVTGPLFEAAKAMEQITEQTEAVWDDLIGKYEGYENKRNGIDATGKAKAKALQDGYDKYVGQSFEKTSNKYQVELKKQLDMVKEKAESEIKAAEKAATEAANKYGTESEEAGKAYKQVVKLKEQLVNDLKVINDKNLADWIDVIQKKIKAEQEGQEKISKIREGYYKAIGDDDGAWLEKRKQEQLQEQAAVKSHYDIMTGKFKDNAVIMAAIAGWKSEALAKVDAKYSKDNEQSVINRNERELKHQKEADNAMIASIKKQIAEHVVSEEEGNRQILLIQQKGTQALLEEAKKRVELLKAVNPDSEEYKKAVDALKKLETEFTGHLTKEIADREKARKQAIENELAAAKNSYQNDLLAVQEAENNKTLSKQEASTRRLQIARDEADQEASIRAAEVAMYDPDKETDKYQAALAKKLAADKAYLSAKQAVTDDEAKQLADLTAKHAEEIQKRMDAEKAEAEQSSAFAEGWFAQWDAAYNSARESLQGLSDAAYNAWAVINEQPLKTADAMETLKLKAAEAAEKFGEMKRQNQETAMIVGAGWGDAYKRLGDISVQAQRITADWYAQKVAAEELALAMEKPESATKSFLEKTEAAIRNMNLLDESDLEKLTGSIKKIKDEMLAFTDRVKDALASLQDEWDNLTMSKLELEEKDYAEKKLAWEKDYQEAKRQGNEDALKALQEQLALLTKIHNANITTLAADESNSISPVKRAIGGWIPGIGNSDSVHAMLTPGEYVIRKSAAAYFGNDFLHAINNMRLPDMSIKPPVLHFATGGPVPQVQTAGASINITINTTQPVDDVFIRRKIMPELERIARLKA